MKPCKHGVVQINCVCSNCQQEQWKKSAMKVRRIIGKISQILWAILEGRGTASCPVCGLVGFVQSKHSVDYGDGSGCNTICNACWNDLMPMERLAVFHKRWKLFGENEYKSWEVIEQAVLGDSYSGSLILCIDDGHAQYVEYMETGTLPEVNLVRGSYLGEVE